MDPVTLGLCSQIDLDMEVQRANKEKPAQAETQSATLLPAAETTARKEAEAAAAESRRSRSDLNVDTVFAKLKQIGSKGERGKRVRRRRSRPASARRFKD